MNARKMLSYAFPILEIKGDTKQNREISEDLRNSGKYPNARLLWEITDDSKVRRTEKTKLHEVWDLRKMVGEDTQSIYSLWRAFKVSVPIEDVIGEFKQPSEVRSDHYFKTNGNFDACHIDAWFTGSDEEEGTMVATVYSDGRIKVEERNLDIWNSSSEVQRIAFEVRDKMLK